MSAPRGGGTEKDDAPGNALEDAREVLSGGQGVLQGREAALTKHVSDGRLDEGDLPVVIHRDVRDHSEGDLGFQSVTGRDRSDEPGGCFDDPLCCRSAENALTVPWNRAVSAITLGRRVPAWNVPTLITTGSNGSNILVTMVWRAVTISHAAGTGSLARYGAEP